MVLDSLSTAPFKPVKNVPDKFLAPKTVFLLAITSLVKVGDLQALSVSQRAWHLHLEWLSLSCILGWVTAKLLANVPWPIVLQGLCPPPFREQNQGKLNLVCQVQALDAYVHRCAPWRRSEQLFVCFGTAKKDFVATKPTKHLANG